MLNRADIRRECHRVTFEKGDGLQVRGAVRNLEWENLTEDGFEIVRIGAQVARSGGSLYDVELKVDEEYREILKYTCECAAFYTYSGLCKHCVATLLEYMGQKQAGRRAIRAGASEKPYAVRTTTYGFEGLLNCYALKDKVNLLQKGLLGTVRLAPEFIVFGDSMRVEFRLGNTRLYVLKNIGEFVNAVAQGSRVEYGKELAFYHHLEAFTPSCRPLVRFLVYTLLKGSSFMGNYLSTAYKRELLVGGDMIDDYMESVSGLVPVGALADGRKREWEVLEGPPRHLLEIEGTGNGALVKIQQMPMITGRKYLYFFGEGIIYRAEREAMEEVREFLLYMDSFGRNGLFVAGSELPAFARDLLPLLNGHFEVKTKDFFAADYLPQKVRFELYLDAPQMDLLTCALYALYGEEKYNLFEPLDLTERRDARAEMELSSLVSSFFDAFDPERHQMVITEEEKLYDFLQEGLPRLQEICTVYVSDAVHSFRIRPVPHVNVGLSLTGDLLELSLSCEEMPLDQLIAVLSRYDRKRKYYRLKDGSFVNFSNEGICTLAGLKQGLDLDGRQLAKGRVRIPRYRAMYLDERLQEGSGLGVHRDRDFRALVRNMKTARDADFEIPEELEGVLRGYQKTGFLWIKTLQENGFGGILADDMGLGKTLQVIAFFLSEWQEAKGAPLKPSLVVCPASLVYNWKNELERFAPILPVFLAAGSAAQRKAVLEEVRQENRGILVTSYDLLRRDADLYEGMEFACQIIDEAQFIKNHTTQAARAVKQVCAAFRLALTGTPVENRLSELWSIFDYLMPGFLFSYARFREELETPIVAKTDEEAAKRLQRLIRPFILRRLKRDVLSDLPEKIEKNMYAQMEGEQRDLYDAHVQRLVQVLSGQTEEEFASSRIQVLAELTKLRQLCCDPALLLEGYQAESAKTRLCLELIRNALDGGHKVLLFSQFTSMLDRLKECLDKEGIGFFSLDGSTSKAKRMELVERFNQDDTPVFCISLKAGGTGLNLTGADIVIHYDPWWNVAVQNQATDRAHRIGQKNVVTVYRLIAKGTVEEKIVALQEKKKELAEQILGQGETGFSALTREALMEILRER